MNQVIAMHGWSGDSNTWNIWAELFRKNKWIWQSGERGYGTIPPSKPLWIEQSLHNIHSHRVVIAHSLGPHLIDREILEKATDVVLLASFSSFIPNGSESRYLKTALQGMQKNIGTSGEKTMLQNFLQKACQPESPQTIPPGPITKGLTIDGRKRLQADLELLIATNNLPKGLSAHSRVLVIQGQEDCIIVPSTRMTLIKDLKKHLNKVPTCWSIPHTGHLLLVPGLITRVKTWLEARP